MLCLVPSRTQIWLASIHFKNAMHTVGPQSLFTSPLTINLVIARIGKPHTLYDIHIHGAASGTTWKLSKRFSEFLALRDALSNRLQRCPLSCRSSCDALRSCLHRQFPRKRCFGSNSVSVISSRQTRLSWILLYLLKCCQVPSYFIRCPNARDAIPKLFFEFLHVTHTGDKSTLIEWYAQQHRNLMLKSSSLHVQSVKETTESLGFCVICQMDICTPGTKITLTCQHAYHLTCLCDWYANHKTCPICRRNIAFFTSIEKKPPTSPTFCNCLNFFFPLLHEGSYYP